MSLPNQIDAYHDCFAVFDQALGDKDGVRVKFQTEGEAKIFMLRMHQGRALQRGLHRRLFTAEDPQYGRSEYDRLIVRNPREDEDGFWWVYIEHTTANVLAIESISTLEPIDITLDSKPLLDTRAD